MNDPDFRITLNLCNLIEADNAQGVQQFLCQYEDGKHADIIRGIIVTADLNGSLKPHTQALLKQQGII